MDALTQSIGLAVAFGAGILSFLSPCVLPLGPSSRKWARVRDLGERPEPFRPVSSFFSASQTMANRSPPMPQPTGSMSPRAALAAMAASTALPPFLRISTAIWVARGWLVAAMPWGAMTSERVVKS